MVLSQVLEATENVMERSTHGDKISPLFYKGLCLRAILNPRNSSLGYGAGLGQASPCVFSSLL